MLICPHDCHICHLPDCRASGCELTGEPPLKECVECGAVLIIGAGRIAVCMDCTKSRSLTEKAER